MLDINKTDLEMKIKLFEQRTIKNAARQHEWIHINIWCSRLNDFVKEKSVVFQTFFQQLHGSKERRCRSNNKGIPLWSHRIKILKILYFLSMNIVSLLFGLILLYIPLNSFYLQIIPPFPSRFVVVSVCINPTPCHRC